MPRRRAPCGNRAYLFPLIERLANPHMRGDVIEALARFGPQICGALGDMLLADTSASTSTRRQIPRVLKLIPHQRSVDVLLAAIGHTDLSIRGAVLKALNRLRETAPELNFENTFVTEQIYREARYYFETERGAGAVCATRRRPPGPPATCLCARSRNGCSEPLERLFRLLGLRYPPKEIYSSYLAVSRGSAPKMSRPRSNSWTTWWSATSRRCSCRCSTPPSTCPERGRDLFGVEIPDAESALRELIRSRDPWLTACAMAAAAELQFRKLAPEIAKAAERSEPEVTEVAQAAQAVLA